MLLGSILALYRFWAHLIWVPKSGKSGEKIVKVKIDVSCIFFLAYKRSVQLFYETLYTLIEALTAFTVRQS